MDGELHKQNIRSELSGFFTQGHTDGTVVNGRFEFDEGTLRGLVTDWLNLADHYGKSTLHANKMAQIDPPGEDLASGAHASVANASGQSYVAYIQQNQDYCIHQAQLFQNALDDYLGVEHRTVTEINKSGPRAGI